MKELGTILHKVFVIQFYKNNATLFLLVLVLAGGFMRGADHVALGLYFVHSHALVLIPILVWLLYSILVVRSNWTTLKNPENSFLSEFCLFSKNSRLTSVTTVTFIQLAPVYLYDLFLIGLAVKEKEFTTAIILLAASISLTIICSTALLNALMKRHFESDSSALRQWMGRKINRGIVFLFIEGAVRKQFAAIMSFKVFSILILTAAAAVCESEFYDIRLPGIFVVFAFALNVTFIFELHHIETKFDIYRQMPLSILQRYTYQLLTIFMFCLPEGFLLIRSSEIFSSLSSSVQLFVFGASINILFYNYQYVKSRSPEKLMPFVYFCSVLIFLATLAKVPLWFTATVNYGAALILLRKYYYRFELASAPD